MSQIRWRNVLFCWVLLLLVRCCCLLLFCFLFVWFFFAFPIHLSALNLPMGILCSISSSVLSVYITYRRISAWVNQFIWQSSKHHDVSMLQWKDFVFPYYVSYTYAAPPHSPHTHIIRDGCNGMEWGGAHERKAVYCPYPSVCYDVLEL